MYHKGQSVRKVEKEDFVGLTLVQGDGGTVSVRLGGWSH